MSPGVLSLRDAKREAVRLGCEIDYGHRGGEIRVVPPPGFGRAFVIHATRKDAPKVLMYLLRRLESYKSNVAKSKPVAKDPLAPSPALLCKLGSAFEHAEELYGPGGHHFDKSALDVLLKDPEVVEWMAGMRALGMLPAKR